MDLVVNVIQLVLGAAALPALIRVGRGPTLVDRIVALDLILLLLAGGIAAEGARRGSELFVPVIVVVTLVAFVGTVVVARFVEWRDT